MNKWQILKAVSYVALAVMIFIFNNTIIPYIGFLVGGVVFLYAIEELIVSAAKRTLFTNVHHLCEGITQLFIGTVLFLVSRDIFKVCLIWGVWSILRESKEMAEAIENIVKNRLGILNVIESVIVIILSFLLILEPNEEHVRLHVILLGIELITVVVFFFLELLRDRTFKNKVSDNSEDDTNEITI